MQEERSSETKVPAKVGKRSAHNIWWGPICAHVVLENADQFEPRS